MLRWIAPAIQMPEHFSNATARQPEYSLREMLDNCGHILTHQAIGIREGNLLHVVTN
jgi:hypothetical protein